MATSLYKQPDLMPNCPDWIASLYRQPYPPKPNCSGEGIIFVQATYISCLISNCPIRGNIFVQTACPQLTNAPDGALSLNKKPTPNPQLPRSGQYIAPRLGRHSFQRISPVTKISHHRCGLLFRVLFCKDHRLQLPAPQNKNLP